MRGVLWKERDTKETRDIGYGYIGYGYIGSVNVVD